MVGNDRKLRAWLSKQIFRLRRKIARKRATAECKAQVESNGGPRRPRPKRYDPTLLWALDGRPLHTPAEQAEELFKHFTALYSDDLGLDDPLPSWVTQTWDQSSPECSDIIKTTGT